MEKVIAGKKLIKTCFGRSNDLGLASWSKYQINHHYIFATNMYIALTKKPQQQITVSSFVNGEDRESFPLEKGNGRG